MPDDKTPAPIQTRYLDNGIPLLTEHIPHLRSASLGVWVQTGSRDEHPAEHGISHFLEHTFFKGTTSRSARDIAEQVDALGGDLNAFTSREQTAFYIKSLSDTLPEAADLLFDVFTRPTFPEDELVRERQVVVEEIRMVEDDPEEWIHDLHAGSMWGDDAPLGRTILGSEASVGRMDGTAIHSYLARRYTPGNIVVSAAGNLDPEHLYRMANATLGQLPAGGHGTSGNAGAHVSGAPSGAVSANPPERTAALPHAHFRPLEQVHLCVGGQGLPAGHPDRFVLYVLNDLLGGGGSSRLFQEIRELRGLAYTVYSSHAAYRDCGEVTIYAGCGPESAAQVLGLIGTELDRLCDEPVGAEELARTRGHLKGSLMLGMESTFNRMSRLAQDQVLWGAPQELDVILRGIDQVTPEQILTMARHAFEPSGRCITTLGSLRKIPQGTASALPNR
ncbi:MAG: insulinase family protein [Nitrospirota bacterium]|nr:insulinase family protein [Nitrospirota bacterium]